MANYNNAHYVEESINSVLNQSFNNWELLIIDDFSQDSSVKIIKKYLDNSKIRFFKNIKNIGYTRNLIKGVKESRGNIIVILDSDDAIRPDTLEKLAQHYKNSSDCDYVYSQCYYCNEDLKPVHLGFSKKISRGKTNLHDNSVVALRSFKKSTYLKTSGYDENIKYAEDIDLTLKIEEVGKLCFLDEPLYNYRVLDRSQTHGFRNTQINRSSTALAKLNAYKRRLGTDIPNLNKNEIAEVLFFGILTSILAVRLNFALKFIVSIFKINPLFFLRKSFYYQILKKIIKIIKLKKEKPLLKI